MGVREEGAQGATIVSVLYNRVLHPDGKFRKEPGMGRRS